MSFPTLTQSIALTGKVLGRGVHKRNLSAGAVSARLLNPHPNSLAHSLVHHYHLNTPTANLIHGVLGEGKSHELGSALFAVAG